MMRRVLKFRLRSALLLVACVAVALAVWRWIAWPDRTVRELDRLIAQGRTSAAEALIVFEPNYRYPAEKVARQLKQDHTPPLRRSWSDLLYARQVFRPQGDVACWVQMGAKFDHVLLESVTVERGVIRYQWGRSLDEWMAEEMQRQRQGAGDADLSRGSGPTDARIESR